MHARPGTSAAAVLEHGHWSQCSCEYSLTLNVSQLRKLAESTLWAAARLETLAAEARARKHHSRTHGDAPKKVTAEDAKDIILRATTSRRVVTFYTFVASLFRNFDSDLVRLSTVDSPATRKHATLAGLSHHPPVVMFGARSVQVTAS